MRDNSQPRTDVQSICSSSAGDAPSSTMSRGGASMTPLAPSSTGGGGGGGSSSSVGNAQHPLPFQSQPSGAAVAATASQHNYSSNIGAAAVQQHHHGLNQLGNSFAASSVSSSLAIGSPAGGSFVGLPGTNSLIGGGGENSVRGGYHALYGGSSSFALTTNATSTATAAPSVGAAAPSPYCCECSTAQNRCSSDLCPCFASRRMCDEHCESAR